MELTRHQVHDLRTRIGVIISAVQAIDVRSTFLAMIDKNAKAVLAILDHAAGLEGRERPLS